MADTADRLERESWKANPSAFWLDPDRWHGASDNLRDPGAVPFWMTLDVRPKPEPVWPWTPGAIITINDSDRDEALAMLAEANDAEAFGNVAKARLWRDMASRNIRRTLERAEQQQYGLDSLGRRYPIHDRRKA